MRSRHYNNLLRQSSNPHDVTLVKLGKRMLALGITDINDLNLVLSAREKLSFIPKNKTGFIQNFNYSLGSNTANNPSFMRKEMKMQSLMKGFVTILKMEQDLLCKNPVVSMERLEEIEKICEVMKSKSKLSLVQSQQLSSSNPSFS
jgi:hypothetical protein